LHVTIGKNLNNESMHLQMKSIRVITTININITLLFRLSWANA